jgi:arylsulfatase A-like enzyme
LILLDVPGVSIESLAILGIVAIGFLFAVVGAFCQLSRLICGADDKILRFYSSMSLTSLLILWIYVIEDRNPLPPSTGEYINSRALAQVDLFYPLIVSAIGAVFFLLLLRREVKPKEDLPRGRILARACLNLAIAFVVVVVGISVLDYSLFSSVSGHPDRYMRVDGNVRNAWIAPAYSDAVFRFDVPRESTMHLGFGVSRETFEAIPRPITYSAYITQKGSPWKEIFNEKVDGESDEGWRDVSLKISPEAGASIEVHMQAEHADSSFLSEILSICRYYLRFFSVSGPTYSFDISQRAAVWVEPTLAPLRTPEETNIILIGIDALRADHMSVYGYERETTPNIDTFAESGAIFTNSYSAAPWTLPSFFSMLTSTYPSVHQYGTNFRGEVRATSAAIWKIGTISPDYNLKTLAEILRERGYYTAAFTNNPFLSTENEVDRGFDEFNQYGPTSVEGVDLVLPWLDRHRNDKFFLFFHVMDPHDFSLKGSKIYELPPRFGDTDGDLLAMETNKYDTSVSFCDEQMGELFEGIKWLGLGHHSLVIVTSDHGEELHDRGGTGHGHSLYDELLRVPLILRPPGGLETRKIFDERVSAIDIAPTILDALEIPEPSYYQGESLAPLLAGDSLVAWPIFAESLGGGDEKKAVIADDYKMIYTATSNEFELYNLKDDPKEERNLVLRAPEIERKMKETLQKFVAQSHEGFHVALNPPAGLELCEGTLSTEGVFIRVMPLDLTKSGIFRVDDDSRRIHFRLRGEHGVSGFFFRVYPADTPVKLELTRKGDGPATEILLGATDGNPLAAPVEFDREMLRALGASDRPEMEDEGLYVWLKETGRESKTIEIDTKTKEKLEALGYLGG